MRQDLERRVAAVKASGLFAAAEYALRQEARALGQDPAEHYLLTGEARGVRPSSQFDPVYYARKHGIRGDSPLIHYLVIGREKGLRPRPAAEDYAFVVNGFRPGLPRIILPVEGGGAAGDPGTRALLKALRPGADVVLAFADHAGNGHPLVAEAAAAALPRARLGVDWLAEKDEGARLAHWLAAKAQPSIVLCRNGLAAPLTLHLANAFITVVLLFDQDMVGASWQLIDRVMAHADTVVFSPPETEAHYRARFPALASRRTLAVAETPELLAAIPDAVARTARIRASYETLLRHPDVMKAIADEFAIGSGHAAWVRDMLLIRGRDTGEGPAMPAPRLSPETDALKRLSRKAPAAEADPEVKAILAPLAARSAGNLVIRPGPGHPPPASGLRVALHGHYYYPELLPELLDCLAANRTVPDLFLSTDSAAKKDQLEAVLAARGKTAEIRIFPNRGRDVAPFFTGFRDLFAAGRYDVLGHVHSKKSPDLGSRGEKWRLALLEGVVGRNRPMLDWIMAEISASPAIGLVGPALPRSSAWDQNFRLGEDLARRMGLKADLARPAFEYPAGMMFWCRPAALGPLTALDLQWTDYPPEPLPGDGTIAHAIERLLPFICESEGYRYAAVVPVPAA